MKQMLIWIGALIVGAILGLLQIGWLDDVMNFVATVYVRLFQLLAVPTIVLAVTTTLALSDATNVTSGMLLENSLLLNIAILPLFILQR